MRPSLISTNIHKSIVALPRSLWMAWGIICPFLWFMACVFNKRKWEIGPQEAIILHSEGERIDKSSLCFHILNNMKCSSNCGNL
jgi:hypothetical protein